MVWVVGVVVACGGGSDVKPPDAPPDAPSGPPSCVGVPATCGSAGTGDCCESPLVEGGMFFRDYDLGSDANYKSMNAPATISSVRLDKYEVTVGRFRKFIAAGAPVPAVGAGAHPNIPNSGWDASWNAMLSSNIPAAMAASASQGECYVSFWTWTDQPGPNDDEPIDCVDWFEAFAFCAWDGGFLPTDTEWNYAASGGSEQRVYPWSSPPSSMTITFGTDCACDARPRNGPVGVGTLPAGDGKWGQSDLAGNVFEWTLDASYVAPAPCDDCADLGSAASSRNIRGGAFAANTELRSAGHNNDPPTSHFYFNGFRCARAP